MLEVCQWMLNGSIDPYRPDEYQKTSHWQPLDTYKSLYLFLFLSKKNCSLLCYPIHLPTTKKIIFYKDFPSFYNERSL